MLPMSPSLVQPGHDQGAAAGDAPASASATSDQLKTLTLDEVDALIDLKLTWDEDGCRRVWSQDGRSSTPPLRSISFQKAHEHACDIAALAAWCAQKSGLPLMAQRATEWEKHRKALETAEKDAPRARMGRFQMEMLAKEASEIRQDALALRKRPPPSHLSAQAAYKDVDGIFHPPGSARADQRKLNDLRNSAARATSATSKGVPQPAHSLSSLQRRMVIDGKVVVGPPASMPARSIGMTEATRRSNPSTDRGDAGH